MSFFKSCYIPILFLRVIYKLKIINIVFNKSNGKNWEIYKFFLTNEIL